MNQYKIMKSILLFLTFSLFTYSMNAQEKTPIEIGLSQQHKSIIIIAAQTAKGDLVNLKVALSDGLDYGLTVNEIKEVLVHTYAYCGFPRSIRGLQTFMEVINERKAKGIIDKSYLTKSVIIFSAALVFSIPIDG